MLLWGVCFPCVAVGQIRTIPQALRDSVNHPTTVVDSPMDFVEENYELVDEIRFLRIYKLSEDAGK